MEKTRSTLTAAERPRRVGAGIEMGDFVNVTENKILIKMHLWMREKEKAHMNDPTKQPWVVQDEEESSTSPASLDHHAVVG